MAKAKETAEQKLKKMIEAGADGSSSKTERQVAQKQNALTTARTLNKFLFLALFGSLAFLVYQVSAGIGVMNRDLSFLSDTSMSKTFNAQDLIPNVQRLSFYLAAVQQRNIFMPYQEEAQMASDQAEQNKNARLSKKIDRYKLVGISWLDKVDTASALIEDTEKNVTYFLHKGEKIDNITVKTIYADSVELAFDNEEILISYDKSKQ